jgi:hypothetical protein
MDRRKDHEPPHQEVVNEAGPLLAAEYRHTPALPEYRFGEEHVEAADNLKDCRKNSDDIGQTGQDIVTQAFVVVVADIAVLQQGFPEIDEVPSGEWQDIPYPFLRITENVQE